MQAQELYYKKINPIRIQYEKTMLEPQEKKAKELEFAIIDKYSLGEKFKTDLYSGEKESRINTLLAIRALAEKFANEFKDAEALDMFKIICFHYPHERISVIDDYLKNGEIKPAQIGYDTVLQSFYKLRRIFKNSSVINNKVPQRCIILRLFLLRWTLLG